MRVSDDGKWIYMANGSRFKRTALKPGAAAIQEDDIDMLDQFVVGTGGKKKVKGRKAS